MTSVQIDTDPAHKPGIESGGKTMTVRYEFERELHPGDTLIIKNADTGEVVAERNVLTVFQCPVRDVLDNKKHLIGAHYPIESIDELIDTLNGYYDHLITESTVVTVIVYCGPP